MKVSEAKEKVCPFIVEYKFKTDALGNRVDSAPVGNKKCICGDCMAWAYTKEVEYNDIVKTKITLDLNEDKSEITEQHELIGEYMIGVALSKTYGIPKKLLEDNKEGYCKRLSDNT